MRKKVPIEEKLLERCGKDILDPLDSRILEMALSPDGISQDRLDGFLSEWDIEKAPIKSVMLLAYAVKGRNDLSIKRSVGARLEGVLRFCRFQNLKKEAHFGKVAKALGAAGIPVMILKGGAMKVYRPDYPRWMNDIDFMVREADYDRAVRIATDLGYGDPMVTSHSTDLRIPGSGESLFDIHKSLELFTGKETGLNEGLFARAEKRNIFSAEALIPTPEDMVFIALVNLYKNLSRNQTPESSVTTFFDLKYLTDLRGDRFDWNIVKENALKTGSEYQAAIAARIVSSVVKDVFPAEITLEGGPMGKRFRKAVLEFFTYRTVLSPQRDSFAGTRVGASLGTDYNIFSRSLGPVVKLAKKIMGIPLVMRVVLKIKYLKEKRGK